MLPPGTVLLMNNDKIGIKIPAKVCSTLQTVHKFDYSLLPIDSIEVMK